MTNTVQTNETYVPKDTSIVQNFALVSFMRALGYNLHVTKYSAQIDLLGYKGYFVSEIEKKNPFYIVSMTTAIGLYNLSYGHWVLTNDDKLKCPIKSSFANLSFNAYLVDKAVLTKPFEKIKLYYSKSEGMLNMSNKLKFTVPYYEKIFLEANQRIKEQIQK